MQPLLSVIIPLGPDEDLAAALLSESLLDDLCFLPQSSEIIFASCKSIDQAKKDEITQRLSPYPVNWLLTEQGRAIQMNTGAAHAKGEFLWFLHWDSRFEPGLIDRLRHNLEHWPRRLHYCRLEFMPDGSGPMLMNQWGANLRSWLLGVPFGDQGFCIRRELFNQIGTYPTTVPYGEDHLFVWYARQQGIKLKCTQWPLRTSARKYKSKGWGFLTARYQLLWLKQAWPEFIRLLRTRF